MKFIGVIEADNLSQIMTTIPIMGLCVLSDGRFCMGDLTGDLRDLPTLGHISAGGRSDLKGWVNELEAKFPPGSFPEKYRIKVCTYKEACKKALTLYGDEDYLTVTGKSGSSITYDLKLIKNNLKKVIESK